MRKMLSLLMVGMIVSLVSTNGFATMTRQEMQEWIETHKECQFAPKENKSLSVPSTKEATFPEALASDENFNDGLVGESINMLFLNVILLLA